MADRMSPLVQGVMDDNEVKLNPQELLEHLINKLTARTNFQTKLQSVEDFTTGNKILRGQLALFKSPWWRFSTPSCA